MKIFCVGHNKTGITSLGVFLKNIGYRLNDQFEAEKRITCWSQRDFSWIKEYCDRYEAFKDVPFSLPDTYKICDVAYPDSKFILTIREEKEWFQSLLRFHEKILKIKLPCDPNILKNLKFYKHKTGWFWECQKSIYIGSKEENLYKEKVYIEFYKKHNQNVIDYFKGTKKLLIVNVKEEQSAKKICLFLKNQYHGEKMPHLNKS